MMEKIYWHPEIGKEMQSVINQLTTAQNVDIKDKWGMSPVQWLSFAQKESKDVYPDAEHSLNNIRDMFREEAFVNESFSHIKEARH